MEFHICETCFDSFIFLLAVILVYEFFTHLVNLLLHIAFYFREKTNYFNEKRKSQILSRGESLPEPFFKRLFSRFFKK